MLEPVHTSPNAGELAAGEVLHQKLRRVSGVEGLLGRKVSLLCQGSLIEAVPTRLPLPTLFHAAILTGGLVLCKAAISTAGLVSCNASHGPPPDRSNRHFRISNAIRVSADDLAAFVEAHRARR